MNGFKFVTRRFLILGLLMMLFTSISFADSTNIINVSGKGSVYVKPDVFKIELSVENRGKETKYIQEQNSKISNKLKKDLLDMGIKEDDIKTLYYKMYEEKYYDEVQKVRKFKEYVVTNTIEVTTYDIDLLAKIIDMASKENVSSISNIQFDVLDKKEHYNKALKLAYNDAKSKADALSEAMNVSIKSVNKVSENSSYPTYLYRKSYALQDSNESVLDISSGQYKIDATIDVEYKY